ncbi:MAG: DUF4394 domain-containing protein [Planctomycetes bacterium]|nr:DUF4394 domain-containing protein [Planctomycetota bacterium]
MAHRLHSTPCDLAPSARSHRAGVLSDARLCGRADVLVIPSVHPGRKTPAPILECIAVRHSFVKLLLAAVLLAAARNPAHAETIYGFNSDNLFFKYDTVTGQRVDIGTFSGIAPNQTIAAIDYRPNTGQVYVAGVTTNPSVRRAQLYTVDLSNAVLTPGAGDIDIEVNVSIPNDPYPSLVSMDFDPSVDKVRFAVADVFSSLTPSLVNPDTGLREVGHGDNDTLAYDAVNPAFPYPALTAIAYSNNGPLTNPPPISTWYGYDGTTDSLAQIDVAFINSTFDEYTVSSLTPVTLNGIGVSSSVYAGMDISGATGIAYLVLQDDQTLTSTLYKVGLTGPTAGVLTPLYDFIPGENIVEFTVVPDTIPEPTTAGLLALGALTLSMRRRSSAPRP